MKIKKVSIHDFRSIKSLEVNFLEYMVFVGKNNSGKSNILKALNAFFTYDAEIEDFRKEGDTRGSKFTVKVEFNNFTNAEREIHKGKILNEGTDNEKLIVKYTAELKPNKIEKYYEFLAATLKQDTDAHRNRYGGLFQKNIYRSKNKIKDHDHIPDDFKKMAMDFLDQKDSGRFAKAEFKQLRQQYISDLLEQHPGLAKYEYLPMSISKRDPDKQLGTYFFIPAIQDIEKETQYSARGDRSLNNLIDYILDEMTDIEEEKASAQKIEEILRDYYKIDDEDSEMKQLEEVLNEELQIFDNSRIQFNTELPNLGNIIRKSLKVYVDDGIMTEVQYKGHGLQRYLMMVLFKVWSQKLLEQKTSDAASSSSSGNKSLSSSTYFAIEEPELFLHPQYQRIIRTYLQNIAADERHQVILNTHSPNFIEFEDLYELAKTSKPSIGAGTDVVQPLEFDGEGKIIEKKFVHTWGSPQDRAHFRKINRINMNYYLNPNRNELFFADKVVLVEGQTEKMLFQAWANYYFPEHFDVLHQITYIDCLGKFNYQHYIKVLKEFNIPFVVIVDSDSDKSQETQNTNRFIRRDTMDAGGIYLELEPDFEGEFDIVDSDIDDETGRKRNKPFYAYKQFFEMDGTPKEDELELVGAHPKLTAIFRAVYELDLD